MILVLGLLCGLLGLVLGFIVLVALSPTPRPRLPSETSYVCCTSPHPQPLSSLHDDAQVDLTLIVPAYKESARLPGMLRQSIAYLEQRRISYEVLVVDDGSNDKGATVQAALELAVALKGQGGQHIKVISLAFNRGKGGAVTHVRRLLGNASSNSLAQGVLFSRGASILFADADGASQFSDLQLLQNALENIKTPSGHGLALGSRAHMVNTEAVVQRSFLRNFLMRSFHFYLHLLGISSIQDTQCGFKLFTRQSARLIFPSMHVEGWIFDVELITLALLAGIPTIEVPITWTEVEGSKMQLAKDSLQMAIDLLVIRANYALGRWRTPPRIVASS